ncbi:hypothetical protein C8F01DRAFT_1109763 [Mycena amicta]|nr:hypothetical protein C8F01DRAFT_1109763 [Mycena amicta]
MDSVYDWVSRVTRSKREYGAFTRAREFDVDLDALARRNAENAAAQEEAEFEDAPEHHVAACESPAASTSNATSHRPFPFTFPCDSEPLSDPFAPASPLKRKQGLSDPASPLKRKAREALRDKQRRRDSRKATRLNIKAASGSSQHAIVGLRVKATPRVQIDGFELAANVEAVSEPGYVCLPDATLNTRRVKEGSRKKMRVELLPEQREYTLKELVEEHGFSEDDWDGIETWVFIDRQRRQFAVLCGQPGRRADDGENSEWQTEVVEPLNACFEEAAAALSQADREMEKPKKERQDIPFAGEFLDISSHAKRTLIENRRGTHRAETVGVGMGMGRDRPKQFLHSVLYNAVFMHLTAQTPLRRLVGFANQMFSTYAGTLHAYYKQTMDYLFSEKDYRTLHPYFPSRLSVFASWTFNFGPRTVTHPHLDLMNLSWGWCFITALGRFDPNKGGHLVLWDIKRIIRFPPGSTIAIPSALLRHSNISIQQGETRHSFTQFSAGAIFRFVERGFKLEGNAEKARGRMSAEELESFVKAEMGRFQRGMDMYTVYNA